MTDMIRWREAAKKTDTLSLRTFTCTTRRKGKYDPPFHEDEVQRYFRQHAITAANRSRDQGRGGRLMIAEDSQGIAAAYTHQRLDPSRFPDRLASALTVAGPREVVRELCFLAVATHHRGKGGALANEAITEALYDIIDSEPEAERIHVLGQVDYHNTASMQLLERFNFEQLTKGVPPPRGDQRLGWWRHIIDPPR
ncbi:hypothetical protein ACFVVP_26055 [Streptomyces sp. NPDC058128]|uniref:hypothetical protein n=1 Tax=Streptomyces sp. NPDC058128 TaxID=3346352 RepID=UPI0036E52516